MHRLLIVAHVNEPEEALEPLGVVDVIPELTLLHSECLALTREVHKRAVLSLCLTYVCSHYSNPQAYALFLSIPSSVLNKRS